MWSLAVTGVSPIVPTTSIHRKMDFQARTFVRTEGIEPATHLVIVITSATAYSPDQVKAALGQLLGYLEPGGESVLGVVRQHRRWCVRGERAWAKGNGIKVSERGRMPASVLDPFEAARRER